MFINFNNIINLIDVTNKSADPKKLKYDQIKY